MDGVPYPQPLAGPEPQYVPWGVLLVRPIGHPPRPVAPRAADQRSRAYPTLLRVLRWGRYGHRGGPQTPEVGSLAGAPRGPFSSRPPFRCAVCGGWCPVSPGWGGGGGGGGCSLFLAVLLAGVSPPPLVAVRRRWVCLWRGACARGVCVGVWCVVCGVWCAVVVFWWGCGGCVVWLVPRHSWRRFLCATPRHSWLGFAAGGGGRSSPLLAEVSGRRWCVVGLWLVCGVFGPSPLLAEVPVCYSPPLLAGFRCLWWCAVPRHSWLGPAGGGGAWRVVCGVWCVVCGGGVWWVCGWCGWSLAIPGGGSCVLLPATPGWVSMPVAVGGPRHSWLRALGAVPRHSWLGFAGGGGVCWGCGWCVVWLVPRLPWRSFLCATPRHSWLGFAAGGGVRFPATPGWGLLAVVVRGVWCVVCGGGVLAGLWVVCGVVGPSPLLAEVPVCYSPPLLAGFRCRWWWAVPATPGWGPLAAVVCGVWRWCVGCWSLATPGGGPCVLLPATPGWVSLPAVVGGVRCVVCGVWRAAVACVVGLWLVWLVPRHSWRRFLCATPRHSWLGFAAGGGGRSPPLLAGVRWRRWCVVCGGGVSVVGFSPLLAEVPVCYSPPLLAGFRCRWWWAVPATPGWGPLAAVVCGVWRWCVGCWSLATPGGGSCVLLPATPGWVSLPAVVGGVRCVVCGVWRAAVACVVGLWLVWLVPRHSWRRFLCATPRHSWLGFAAGGGGRSPPLLAGVRWRRWCVVCGGGVLVVGPSPLLAEVLVCYSPPLLAGFRCRWWWAVPATPGWGPLAAVVCGVWRWCVGCWSLATPGGGSCVLLPATPGWVSLPAVVGGVRCVVCGVWRAAVACVVGLWLVWLVPRHSWRRFLCATPRHSWLGFAAGGGGRSPPLLAGVRWRRWCVVCGGGVLVVGPSPLLAEVPVCYSPPLLAGFRCRWWWAVPATPGWGPLAAVVCGVWRWCVGCWSLATPGGGSCVLLPATPGWVSLPAVVGVPRHSWRRVPGAVPCHSWLGFAVGGGAWCAVCGVRRVACGGGVCGGFVAGVVGPSPLLAEVPVCYSPPLLAGFRCRWWCGVVLRWVCLPGALPLGPGVCVCAVWPFVLVWVAWGGGGVALGVAVVRARACAWWGGVCHTLAGSRRRSSACFKRQKKRSCRCVAEMRGMCDA